MRKLTTIALVAVSAAAMAQTYGPGPGGLIPDGVVTNTTPGELASIISVAGAPVGVFLMSVDIIFVSDTWAGDIEAELLGPNGARIHLFSRVRGTGTPTFGDSSDLIGLYTFVNSGGSDFNAAATAAGATAAIANGTYTRSTTLPDQAGGLPAINNNGFDVFNAIDPNGDWTLFVRDWAQLDTGELASWSFTVSPVPEPATFVALGIGLAGLAMLRRRK